MRKGQVALEYMGVLIVSIILFIFVIYFMFGTFQERNESYSLSQTQISVNDLATATNYLCNKPEDSMIILYTKIPSFVSLEQSVIGQKRISFSVVTKDTNQSIHANVECDVNGTLPTITGNYKFKLTRTLSNVNITYLGIT